MSAPLMAAIHARLAADAGVQALLGAPARLYDAPSPDAAFPYLSYAGVQTRLADVSETEAAEHVVTLNVWSRYAGAQEAQRVVEAVRAALHHAPLTLAGQRLVLLIASYCDVFRTTDPRLFRGVLRLKAVTEAL